MSQRRIIVVGGGLAGLAVASWLARDGAHVTVLERAKDIGGRARTRQSHGWSLNFGPHALYRAGAAAAGLADLGIRPAGGVVPATGWLRQGGVLAPLPRTPLALLRSPLFSGSQRWSALRWLASVALPSRAAAGRTVTEWLAPLPPRAQAFAHYLVRLSTYVHAPDELDAGIARRQVARALKGVWYLHRGWESLAGALRGTATVAGAQIRTGADVVGATANGVALAGGEALPADAVVLAVPPTTARNLGATVAPTTPVRAACLDLGLASLPRPEARAVFDLDEPLYLSDHAPIARVAPAGGATLHLLRYLSPGEEGSGMIERLEAFADEIQPGWRAQVRVREEARALVVCHHLDRVGVPRTPVHTPEGLWLAGDWVEAGGALLADAAIGSARAVATALRGEGRRRIL